MVNQLNIRPFRTHWIALFCILWLDLHGSLFAQCVPYGSYDNAICNEFVRTYSYVGGCASGHCRYDFGIPPNMTLLSRTANTVTVYIGRSTPSYTYMPVTCYDSVLQCQGWMDWTDRYAQWTYPDIVGTIPVCPTAQPYTYVTRHWQFSNGFLPTENVTWAVTGGTIQSTTTSGPMSGYVYDTCKVLWNPAGPHRLISTRTGTYNGAYGSFYCVNRDTAWDGGSPPPVILGPSSLCSTPSATYTLSTFDPAFTYTWACSNGSIVSGQGTNTVNVNWAGSGTLSITRTALPCGWTDVATKNVTLYASAPPAPNLGPNITACPGQQVLLTPGTFSTYRWSNLYTTQYIQATTAGNYSVTVTNSVGCTASDTVSVNFSGSAPNPNLGPNQTVCAGTVVTLNPGSFSTYSWSTGATTPTISPTTSGTYSVTVTNSCGSASASVTLTFNPIPTPSLGPDQAVCVGPVTLNPGSFTTYSWSTGATTATISPSVSGTYSVTVSNGTCSASDTVVVTINANPLPNLGGNQTICGTTPVTLNPGSYSAYSWSTGATSPTLSVSSSGTYSVTVTDGNGCTGTSAVTITFHPLPTPNLGPNQIVCTGTPVTLNPGSYSAYSWSTGATTPTISPTTNGIYGVTVTDANGCTGSDAMNLVFVPLPTFSFGNDSVICADTSITLNGPAGMSTYAWSTGANTASITVTSGGTYSLTVTHSNGCTASDDIVLNGLTDCVFPGDANYDGVADNVDILSIGAYYGFTGPVRSGASLQWYGQESANWGGALPGQADPKHSDCDGDGLVQTVDTLAVVQNYGRTHTKNSGVTGGTNVLKVIALQDSVLAGDVAWFRVDLGDGLNTIDSAYGVAFTVNHTTLAVANPGLLNLDYSNCWFAGTGTRVEFTLNGFPLPEADVAVVRNDHAEQQGFGEVCTFGILTDSNMATPYELLTAWLTDVTLVNAALRPQSIEVYEDSTVITQTLTSRGNGSLALAPRVYPNPAGDWVRVEVLNGKLEAVEVFDLSGKRLLLVQGEDDGQLSISTAALSAGSYVLRSHTGHGVYFHRLMVVH
jgi:hypothetical protein